MYAHMHAPVFVVKAGQSADMLWLMLWRFARKVSASAELMSSVVQACMCLAQDLHDYFVCTEILLWFDIYFHTRPD